MSDKQKYIIEIIEGNSKYRFDVSGLTPYNFIKEHMDVYEKFKNLQSVRYGMARLCGLSLGGYDDASIYEGNNPMDFRN
jgi:hypothetical protein